MESRDLILSAFRVLITPRLAALSTAENALLKDSNVKSDLKPSIADLALVFVALLKPAFFLSDLNFFIADLINGICEHYFIMICPDNKLAYRLPLN